MHQTITNKTMRSSRGISQTLWSPSRCRLNMLCLWAPDTSTRHPKTNKERWESPFHIAWHNQMPVSRPWSTSRAHKTSRNWSYYSLHSRKKPHPWLAISQRSSQTTSRQVQGCLKATPWIRWCWCSQISQRLKHPKIPRNLNMFELEPSSWLFQGEGWASPWSKV